MRYSGVRGSIGSASIIQYAWGPTPRPFTPLRGDGLTALPRLRRGLARWCDRLPDFKHEPRSAESGLRTAKRGGLVCAGGFQPDVRAPTRAEKRSTARASLFNQEYKELEAGSGELEAGSDHKSRRRFHKSVTAHNLRLTPKAIGFRVSLSQQVLRRPVHAPEPCSSKRKGLTPVRGAQSQKLIDKGKPIDQLFWLPNLEFVCLMVVSLSPW
jgi:hypothetical protein